MSLLRAAALNHDRKRGLLSNSGDRAAKVCDRAAKLIFCGNGIC
jgi:hypothetical protein